MDICNFQTCVFQTSGLWENDLALLKLEETLPIGTDPDIDAVTLPEAGLTDWPREGQECYSKGWGCSENGMPQCNTISILQH